MKKTDLAYTAGLFDGEGYIGFKGKFKTSVRISISQKDPEVLAWIQRWFGGTIREKTTCSALEIYRNDQKLKFLEAIRPYLRIQARREKADRAIATLRRKKSGIDTGIQG